MYGNPLAECWSLRGLSASKVERGNHPDGLEHFEKVQLVPVLHEPTVVDAPDVGWTASRSGSQSQACRREGQGGCPGR